MGRRIGRLVDSKGLLGRPGLGLVEGRWVDGLNFFFEKKCLMVVRMISYFCLFDGN